MFCGSSSTEIVASNDKIKEELILNWPELTELCTDKNIRIVISTLLPNYCKDGNYMCSIKALYVHFPNEKSHLEIIKEGIEQIKVI
jgi:hypothetical protein